jgi:hypothetical protein
LNRYTVFKQSVIFYIIISFPFFFIIKFNIHIASTSKLVTLHHLLPFWCISLNYISLFCLIISIISIISTIKKGEKSSYFYIYIYYKFEEYNKFKDGEKHKWCGHKYITLRMILYFSMKLIFSNKRRQIYSLKKKKN